MITKKLARFINNESRASYLDYSPDHARRLLERFGNPHRHIRTFHVGGTNGKGSVAHMLHSILDRAGYATGLYTSPHLLSVNERIRVGSVFIGNSSLEAYVDDINRFIESDPSLTPTYFDVLTVCAFRHFHDSRVDAAVIEVGLGGRLDSTNVITPLVTVITDISMDHTSLLGVTAASIAREKAGIVKPAVPLVTSFQGPDVMPVLEKTAHQRGAPLFRLGREFSARNQSEIDGGHRFDYRLEGNPGIYIRDIQIGLVPPFQISNACCAATAALLSRRSFTRINDDTVMEGLRACSIPGRFEILAGAPLIIFDPAHNESAMALMIDLVVKRFPGMEIIPIVTFMKDKDVSSMAQLFRARRLRGIYFVLRDERCHNPLTAAEMVDVFPEVVVHDETSLFDTLDAVASPRSLFFFTGSFRLYGTANNYASRCASSGTEMTSRLY